MRIKTVKIEGFNYKCECEFEAREGFARQVSIKSQSLFCRVYTLDEVMQKIKDEARKFSDECDAADCAQDAENKIAEVEYNERDR